MLRPVTLALLSATALPALAAESASINLTGVQIRNATTVNRDSAPGTIDPAKRYTYLIDGMVRGRGGVLGTLYPSPTPLATVMEALSPGSSEDLAGTFWNAPGTHPIAPAPVTQSGSTVILGLTVNFSLTLAFGIRADNVAFFSLTDVVLTPSLLTGYLEFTSGAAVITRVQCAADLNADGVVDFNDLLEFLNLFNAGDALADVNADDVVDFNDFLEFLNIFNAPC
ncbi:MAG: hypothetical protein FJ255_09335 [Phycisphaerae bacterium]|nr:hypothetical protein [Phycisphaerae bacterium]